MNQELSYQDKMRIVQELVPGKQITIAHVIANPDEILYRKLGLDPAVDYSRTAIGIVRKYCSRLFWSSSAIEDMSNRLTRPRAS